MWENPEMQKLMNTWNRSCRTLCCCLNWYSWNISICLTCSRWSRCLCSITCWLYLWIASNLCASILAASAFTRASEEKKKMTTFSRIKGFLPSASHSCYCYHIVKKIPWNCFPSRKPYCSWLYVPCSYLGIIFGILAPVYWSQVNQAKLS